MEHPVAWVLFGIFVLAMLWLDLAVFHKKAHVVSIREALLWSAFWIGLALLFNIGIYYYEGHEAALQFLTGYLIEKSLSIDNLFVFLLIFTYFKVPAIYQHQVLFWGILGALVMRGLFIAVGVALVSQFSWLLYVFGVFLIVTGAKLAIEKNKELHPERNPFIKLFRKIMPVTSDYEEDKFIVKRNHQYWATPLLVVLLVVETTDVIFAMDSIPAIFAITLDPFIVFTSNVFAILGLRALYFALAGVMRLFHHLHYGLSAILVFVGIKMLVADHIHIPAVLALGFIALVLVLSVLASIIWPAKDPEHFKAK
ncbi:MAG: hypothetical protein COV74_00035 [Candidatus Omnitrophica bacterium CG11_big_fil_rev_8_21_14_0_20_45_26]|uniref:Tellurium resistance protein TerC n=1 Tax=Candidatus Abzuiibacterium crystallinum TaxID=1974748 RepID=A0A2H0LT61_9BACT|nr:MAG: hypothetical protein COV74_00035 [Candidatus Omnitrophica bacterium CG11_big_fil_rev_8_21_14_0_20_45_26]PIW65790.1 MAG: hypothetical protein COW12_00035 [Candidatus Omnitrophica bacterium CG12_big_fil_rev_8_21_14_0_65_45_16]